jgi:predicted N-formylglutamate amidohydrolase
MKILRPQGAGRFVLFCDHATNHVPAELYDLGLPASELARHIAWDIGAAGVTEALSAIWNAPAIFSSVSRLVIDCNRHLDAADLIPEVSDGTVIPGNLNLTRLHERNVSIAGSGRIMMQLNRSSWSARRGALRRSRFLFTR